MVMANKEVNRYKVRKLPTGKTYIIEISESI